MLPAGMSLAPAPADAQGQGEGLRELQQGLAAGGTISPGTGKAIYGQGFCGGQLVTRAGARSCTHPYGQESPGEPPLPDSGAGTPRLKHHSWDGDSCQKTTWLEAPS